MTVRHKYGARPSEVDGIRFASQKEAKYYGELKIRQRIGEVLFFLRQVPFHLPGGVKYVADFMEFLSDGTVKVVDVKGVETEMFKAKKRMVEELYAPVKIEVV